MAFKNKAIKKLGHDRKHSVLNLSEPLEEVGAGIYYIRFPNNKLYIGQTDSKEGIYGRLNQHITKAYLSRKHTPLIYDEMKKFKLSDLEIYYFTEADGFGIVNFDETYNAFMELYEPTTAQGEPDNGGEFQRKLDFAEIFHILKATQRGEKLLNIQSGGKAYWWKLRNSDNARVFSKNTSPKEVLKIILLPNEDMKTITKIINQLSDLAFSDQWSPEGLYDFITEKSRYAKKKDKKGVRMNEIIEECNIPNSFVFKEGITNKTEIFWLKWSDIVSKITNILQENLFNNLSHIGLKGNSNYQVEIARTKIIYLIEGFIEARLIFINAFIKVFFKEIPNIKFSIKINEEAINTAVETVYYSVTGIVNSIRKDMKKALETEILQEQKLIEQFTKEKRNGTKVLKFSLKEGLDALKKDEGKTKQSMGENISKELVLIKDFNLRSIIQIPRIENSDNQHWFNAGQIAARGTVVDIDWKRAWGLYIFNNQMKYLKSFDASNLHIRSLYGEDNKWIAINMSGLNSHFWLSSRLHARFEMYKLKGYLDGWYEYYRPMVSLWTYMKSGTVYGRINELELKDSGYGEKVVPTGYSKIGEGYIQYRYPSARNFVLYTDINQLKYY